MTLHAASSKHTLPCAGTAAFITVFFWPLDAGRGSTCDAPGACGNRDDEDRRRRKLTVNLDVGAIINATQIDDIPASIRINRYLAGKRLVITQTALKEFLRGSDGKPASFDHTGPLERLNVYQLLARSTIIPDNPSERVMALTPDSNKSKKYLGERDKIIFGTGDRYGWTTVTVDDKFYKAAKFRGMDLDVQHFNHAEYSGN